MLELEAKPKDSNRWFPDIGDSLRQESRARDQMAAGSPLTRVAFGTGASVDGEFDDTRPTRFTSELLGWIGCLAVFMYCLASFYVLLGALPLRSAGERAGAAQAVIASAERAGGSGERGGSPAMEHSSEHQPLAAVTEDVVASDGTVARIESVAGAAVDPAALVKPGTGQQFRDRTAAGQVCRFCPDMVVVPSGTFRLGAGTGETWRDEWQKDMEAPQTMTTIANPFAVGKFSVTYDEWEACVADGGCTSMPSDSGWGRANRPVVNITWGDANSYAGWLSRKTGKRYRLLSEAEREYVTRAGTTTPFWFGTAPSPKKANYHWDRTLPVNSLGSNPWGLFHVHGNVSEWTSDCWNTTHAGHPGDAMPRQTGNCSRRVVKGGSWFNGPALIRSASRGGLGSDLSYGTVGVRMARAVGEGAPH